MPKIEKLLGREVLDSRGLPTVLATCVLEGGIFGSASVPSGASTGKAEAFQLRDGDGERYHGLGCRRAAANISGELNRALACHEFENQFDLDNRMIALDGTETKSRIGGNTILAVSIAFARAFAVQQRIPLYQYFAGMADFSIDRLPRLWMLLWLQLSTSIRPQPTLPSGNTTCLFLPRMKGDWLPLSVQLKRCLLWR
jgi:enolase